MIRACVNRNSGAIRIVKSNVCGNPLENVLTRNQQGPTGVPGVLGFYTVTASGSGGTIFSALCDAGDEVTGGGFSGPGGPSTHKSANRRCSSRRHSEKAGPLAGQT